MKHRTSRESKPPAATPKTTKRTEPELTIPVESRPAPGRKWLRDWRILSLAWIAACFAFTRLYNLLGLPIFVDEAIFLNWADDLQRNFSYWREHSPELMWQALNRPIAEGKFLHALLYLLVTPSAPVPLLAARLVSVAAGALTVSGCYVIGKRLFGAPAGLLSAFACVFCPLAVFNDRLASPDTLLCAAATWILASAIAAVQEPSRRHFVVLGLAMGLAPLAKTTGILALAIPPIVYVLLTGVKRPSAKVQKLILMACGIAALCIGAVYVPSYLLGAEKPGTRVLYLTVFSGSGQGLFAMLREFWQQIAEALGWMKIYLTLPLLLLALAGFGFAVTSRDRNAILLGVVFAILFCLPVFLARVLFARYLLWAAPPLLVLAAATFSRAATVLRRLPNPALRGIAFAALAALLLSPGIRTAYGYITECADADLPQPDRIQYVEDWPSGYAVRDVVEFLEHEAWLAGGGVNVVCQEYGSNSHLGTRVLLSRYPNITVRYSPVRGDSAFRELAQWTAAGPTYVLVETPPLGAKPEERPDLDRLRQIAQRIKVFVKPGARRSVDLYYVPPGQSGGPSVLSVRSGDEAARARPKGASIYNLISGNVFLVGLLAILQLSFFHGAVLLFWLDRKKVIQSPLQLAVYAFAISPFANFLITLAAMGLQQLHQSYFLTDLLFFAITGGEALFLAWIVWKELAARSAPAGMSGRTVYATAALFATALATAATLYALSGLNPILHGFYNDEPITWNVWAHSWYMSSIPEYTNQYGQLVPTGWALIYRYTHDLGIAAFVKAWMTEFSFYAVLLTFLVGRATRRWVYYVSGVAVWLTVAATVWKRSALYAGYAHSPWSWLGFASFHVDMQVAFYGFLAICTLLIAREAPAKASRLYYLLAILAVAGGAATKQAGIFVAAAVPVIGYALVMRRWSDLTIGRKALFLLGTSVLIAILACPTYLVNQHMIDIGKNGQNTDIARRMASISPTVAGRVVAALQMLAPFFGGPAILLLVTGLFVIGMCSAEGFWIGAAYVLPYAYIWAAYVSYDTTNFATAAPALGLVSGLGAARAGGYLWRRVWGGRSWTPARGWFGASAIPWAARFGAKTRLAAAAGALGLVILAVNSRLSLDSLRSREGALFAKTSPRVYFGLPDSYFAERAHGRVPASGPSGPDRLSGARPQPCQFASSFPKPIYGLGFYPAEGDGSVKHRWAHKESSLWLVMAAGGECAMTFQLVSASSAVSAHVAVRVNGELAGWVEARSSDFARPTVQGLTAKLQSGRNEIRLESEEEEVALTPDLRSAAYAIVLPPAFGHGLTSGAQASGEARAGSARFVAADTATQGAWKGVYGIDGYAVSNDVTSLPLYAGLEFSGQSSGIWTAASTDARALEKSAGSYRVAGAWFASRAFTIDVDLTDGNTHQVALYAVDWDHGSDSERIEVVDAATGTVLDTRTLSAFSGGEFLVWSVKGRVTFRVTAINGRAVASGVFFGGGRGYPGTASFVGEDAATKGSWKGVYGREGFAISGDVTSLPSYAQLDLAGHSLGIFSSSTTDVRALQKATGDDRIASLWLTWTNLTIDVNLTDHQTHRVALYAAGLDSDPRTERIEVLDAVTGKALDARVVTDFSAGKYLVWNVGGHVAFRVTTMVSDAVVSGVFFD